MGFQRPISLETSQTRGLVRQFTPTVSSHRKRKAVTVAGVVPLHFLVLSFGKVKAEKMFIKVKLPCNVMIPAQDMDKGLLLQRAILIRLLNTFALKKSTKDLGYNLALTTLEEIGEGIIRENTGEILFPVVFSGITFKLFQGEIVRGVVHKIFKSGVLMRCGPCENIYLSDKKMTGYKYIPGENPIFVNKNMSEIQVGSTVRCIVLATEWKEAEREFIALASIDGDYLGPV